MSKKPVFHIGFELEGLVRQGAQAEFDHGLHEINTDIDRGTDGSVKGYFNLFDSFTQEREMREANGIEIRTPVLKLAEGLELFNEVIEYLNEQSDEDVFKTNKTCGLHVNISEARMMAEDNKRLAFYARVLSLFPERDVLKLFSRTSNSYCLPLFASGEHPDYDYVLSRVAPSWCTSGTPRLGGNKYHSVGLPDSARIEFRCLGNKDYHKRLDRLHQAMDIILDTVHRAYDLTVNPPKAEREAEQEAQEVSAELRQSGTRFADITEIW